MSVQDITPEGSVCPVFLDPSSTTELGPGPDPVEEVRALRRAAFSVETDPLFFKEQAGEIEPGVWLAKRQEIRERFPYPEGGKQ